MNIAPGDFSALAENYARYRPGYSERVADAVVGLLNRPVRDCVFADVGAGTGIWSRMLAQFGPREMHAVEPNDEMRRFGAEQSPDITWHAGSAEQTGLAAGSADLVSMASSFHWADTQVALSEFDRVLRPGGLLVLLWNPRLVERSATETEIERALVEEFGVQKRVSSGRSGITDRLGEILRGCGSFDSVVYLEAEHVVTVSPRQYLGAWESVNDVRSQLGEARFRDFIDFVRRKVQEPLQVTYLTRAWAGTKP